MNTRAFSLSRRAALQQLAVACGLALSATSLDLLASSFSLPTDKSRNAKGLLTSAQRDLVRQISDLIIPATETPGAAAAGVDQFISSQLFYCLDRDEQTQFTSGLARLETFAQSKQHKHFLSATRDEQLAILTAMELGHEGCDEAHRRFIKQIKGLVVFGYYTSEIGATQELGYLAVPGGYKGDVKFKTLGKAWAL